MTKSRGVYESHGMKHSAVYAVWSGMKSRCNHPADKSFARYGGRGITVCIEWSRFSRFHADMGDPPPGLSLERIDNNKGYSKENCIWTDSTAQGRNKRNNVLLSIDGNCLPLSAWVERYGIKYTTVHERLRKGWTPEAAVKTPILRSSRRSSESKPSNE